MEQNQKNILCLDIFIYLADFCDIGVLKTLSIISHKFHDIIWENYVCPKCYVSAEKLVEFSNIDHFKHVKNYMNEGTLPKELITLIFWWGWNNTLDCYDLPNTIESITFGRDFNHTFYNLPSTLISLTFGEKFNRDFEELPLNLKSLTMGANFNRCFTRYCRLPKDLESLTLGRYYKKVFNHYNVLPKRLKLLSLGPDYSEPIVITNLPNTLESLILGQHYMRDVSTSNKFAINR